MEQKNIFQYSYSASEQEEIRAIRERYAPSTPSRLEQLRALDASVAKAGRMPSIIIGTAGALIFGLGLTCVLEWKLLLPGTLLGILGAVGICAAYPLHRHLYTRQKEKATPQILKLADELMAQNGT